MKQTKPKPTSGDQNPTIEQAIARTGFVLEHKVATLLESMKWSVIHNRYYLDDVTATQREMDMVAYKSSTIDDEIHVFTALIISCKKNDEYDWAFLTRKAPAMSLNINMVPVSFYSNNGPVNYELSNINWERSSLEKDFDSNSLIKRMYNYNNIVFAYQEIRKSNNAPNNDSNIFNSIATLIKAQNYEINSLKSGRSSHSKFVYNINLLSIADLDFHELHYSGEKVTKKSINRINYINRFLIGSQEQHAKIDFVEFNALKEAMEDYNILHQWNESFIKKIYNRFYQNVFTEYKMSKVILDDEQDDFLFWIRHYNQGIDWNVNNLDFVYFHLNDGLLEINVNDSQYIIDQLNNNPRLQTYVTKWLRDKFKYNGEFIFAEMDLPF